MTLLPASVLVRLGWVLLHALWQVALLGGAAALLLSGLRRARPQTRYAVACGFLGLMALAPLATWCLTAPAVAAGPVTVQVLETGRPLADPWAWLRDPRFLQRLAWAWCLGAGLMLARVSGGLLMVRSLYLRRARSAPEALRRQLEALARRMGVTRPLDLRISTHVASPLVVGWLKPVLLVPAAALLNLPPQALEAVLLHELAHVRRHDYLVNLVQSLVEALLFFHPAAWWLSHRIRTLREHCCDDDAANVSGQPARLAEALALLALLRRTPNPAPEPALGAAKGPLMTRIHRLLQPETTAAPSWPLLAVALFAAVAVAQAAPKPKPKPAPAKAAEPADGVHDTTFDHVQVVNQPKAPAYPPDAKAQRIQGTVVVELTIDPDGRPIAAQAVEGPAELRECAETYAKAWTFAPVKVNGQAVKARFKLVMPFKLR